MTQTCTCRGLEVGQFAMVSGCERHDLAITTVRGWAEHCGNYQYDVNTPPNKDGYTPKIGDQVFILSVREDADRWMKEQLHMVGTVIEFDDDMLPERAYIVKVEGYPDGDYFAGNDLLIEWNYKNNFSS